MEENASKKHNTPWQERGPSIASSCGGSWRNQRTGVIELHPSDGVFESGRGPQQDYQVRDACSSYVFSACGTRGVRHHVAVAACVSTLSMMGSQLSIGKLRWRSSYRCLILEIKTCVDSANVELYVYTQLPHY
jgi:hypothetical protein